MKRLFPLLLACLCCLFASCAPKANKNITCEQVIAAYKSAGYEVFHKQTTAQDYDWTCYVKATDPVTQDYIFFHFFDSPNAAEAYADTRQYNVLIWLFSVIYGDPSWQTTKAYNNIEIEYDNSDLYKPFASLT